MILNESGKIAENILLEIPNHFDDVKLYEHVIMPNHVHGIVIIDSDDVGNAYMRSLPYDRTKMKLSKIVQQYKAAVTCKINQIHNEFNWQKSFYDHIIRNDKSLHRIRKYIHYNALKWEYDQENQNEIPLKQKKEFWKDFFKGT